MFVASTCSLPDKFSKIVFLVLNFMESFKLYYKHNNFLYQLLRITQNQTFFKIVNRVADIYSTEFLLNTAMIRGGKLDCN